jgi:hypothetical protein
MQNTSTIKENINEEDYDFNTIPHDFLCPISRFPMIEPVVLLPYGHTYDKVSIIEWLKNSNKCPLANKMTSKIIIPNITLKKMIDDECTKNELLKKYIEKEKKKREEREKKYFKWQWFHFETNKWLDYDNLTRLRIEEAYRDKKQIWVMINSLYYIEFKNMAQTNRMILSRKRKVRRIIVNEDEMQISPKWYYRVIKMKKSKKNNIIGKKQDKNDIKDNDQKHNKNNIQNCDNDDTKEMEDTFLLEEYAPMSPSDCDKLNEAIKTQNKSNITVGPDNRFMINFKKMIQYNRYYSERKRDIIMVK